MKPGMATHTFSRRAYQEQEDEEEGRPHYCSDLVFATSAKLLNHMSGIRARTKGEGKVIAQTGMHAIRNNGLQDKVERQASVQPVKRSMSQCPR